MWHHTLHHRWTTSIDTWCCRTNCYHVHLSLQLCQKARCLGAPALLGLVWMVIIKQFPLLMYTVWNTISVFIYFPCRVCVWTALMLFLLATFNASAIINRFTRVAGELFGMLIAVLFMQEAIKVLARISLILDAWETLIRNVKKDHTQWFEIYCIFRVFWVNLAFPNLRTMVLRDISSSGCTQMACLESSLPLVSCIQHWRAEKLDRGCMEQVCVTALFPLCEKPEHKSV